MVCQESIFDLKSNFYLVKKAVEMINEAVDSRDEPKLMAVMTSPEASLSGVKPENSSWYMQNLVDEKALKAEVCLFFKQIYLQF